MTGHRERLTGLYDALNAAWGDDPGEHLDEIREYADPDIELVVPREYLDVGQLRGYEGLEQWLTMAAGVFDSWRYELEDVLDMGEDRAVALLRAWIRGKASGAEMELRAAHVIDFRAGRVVRLAVYRDRSQALAAVGLA